MSGKYADNALLFKVLSDQNRLMIIDMLSCGELCACVILEKFKITQPTLSYHMKALCDSDLVNGRKQGKWMYYSLNEKKIKNVQAFFNEIVNLSEDCICNENSCETVCDE
jgi:ArsR family transcriptional regulator